MRLSPALSDKARGLTLLCSLLVCFAHAATLSRSYVYVADQPFAFTNNFIQCLWKFGLARISTPFFFCLSAFLLLDSLLPASDSPRINFRAAYLRELRKRMKTLLAPFLVWSLISFLTIYSLQLLPITKGYLTRPLSQESFTSMLAILTWDPVGYPLWFMRNLFILVALSPLIYLIIRKRYLGIGFMLLTAIGWFLGLEDRSFRSLLFFSLGAFISIHRPVPPRLTPSMTLALLFLWVGIAGCHALTIMYSGQESVGLNNACIITGLLAVWYGYDLLGEKPRAPMLQYIAGFTFFVYVAHEPLTGVLRKTVTAVVGADQRLGMAAWLASGVVVFLGFLAVAMIMNQRFPRLYGFLSGGRGRHPQNQSDKLERTVAMSKAPSKQRCLPSSVKLDPLPPHIRHAAGGFPDHQSHTVSGFSTTDPI